MKSSNFQIYKRLALLILVTVILTVASGEMYLRARFSDQSNYIFEMWRYAKELKQQSPYQDVGHVHIPLSSARLQNIDFRINSIGIRGPELDPNAKANVVVIGSSIPLGWGVPESQVMGNIIGTKLGPDVQVLNGGVGNFNLSRSVSFLERYLVNKTNPDVVVLAYFVNDAEFLGEQRDSWLFRNSAFFVFLYNAFSSMNFLLKHHELESYYQEVYNETSLGYREMTASLDKLVELSINHNFDVVFAMIPDIHQLQPYRLKFVHDHMAHLARNRGWKFIDLLPIISDFKGPELWTIPGDPHPNAKAHRHFGEALAPIVKDLLGGPNAVN